MSARINTVWRLAGLVACSVGEETEMSTARKRRPRVVTEADIPTDIDRHPLARVPIPDRHTLDADGRRAYDVLVNPDSRYAAGRRGR